jgi:zinc transporter 9
VHILWVQDVGNLQVWDGVGSILVGIILAGVAVYLIQRNRSFLIGRSMAVDDFQKIVHHLRRDPVVKNVYEAKSEEIGEGVFRCLSLISLCFIHISSL